MIRLVVCIAAALALALTLPPARAAADACAGVPSERFSRPFPSSAAEVTRWAGTVCAHERQGLVLANARFRTAPGASFVKMLHDARLAEVYVYYHDGLSFLDVRNFSSGLMPLDTTDCPPALGTLMLSGRACLEVRDRGLAYRTGERSRRGEELVVWGVNVSANYKYVIEWRLRDDGVVVGRVGATGQNLPGHHDVPHVHLVTWRLDVDLGGSNGDSVDEITHVESAADETSHDAVRRLTVEDGRLWSAPGLRYWRVSDPALTNAQGHVTGLRLMAARNGVGRHVEPYTASDVWVTRGGVAKAGQLFANELPAYARNAQPVEGTDVVLWYSSPIHHVPRDEDDGVATQLMWVDVTLVPENLFAGSPLP